MSLTPVSYTDAIDSHYQWVKSRIIQANSNRKVLGLLEAQDWPAGSIQLESFYLLTLGITPVGAQAGSISGPHEAHLIQWVWVIQGDDIASGARGRNRGNRFRINAAMKGEIRTALYPQYTEKLSWALNGDGRWIGSSKVPAEYITWSRPQFMPRLDKESGLVYGAVSVYVTDMLDQIPA